MSDAKTETTNPFDVEHLLFAGSHWLMGLGWHYEQGVGWHRPDGALAGGPGDHGQAITEALTTEGTRLLLAPAGADEKKHEQLVAAVDASCPAITGDGSADDPAERVRAAFHERSGLKIEIARAHEEAEHFRGLFLRASEERNEARDHVVRLGHDLDRVTAVALAQMGAATLRIKCDAVGALASDLADRLLKLRGGERGKGNHRAALAYENAAARVRALHVLPAAEVLRAANRYIVALENARTARPPSVDCERDEVERAQSGREQAEVAAALDDLRTTVHVLRGVWEGR